MRFFSWLTILIILLLALMVTTVRDEGTKTFENVTEDLKYTSVFFENVTNVILPYKDPYNESFRIEDFAINTGHIIVYPVMKELEMVIAIGSKFVWDNVHRGDVVKVLQVGLGLIVLWIIAKFMVPFGVVYLLLQNNFEKRNWKVPNWIIVILSIAIILVIITGVFLLLSLIAG